MSPETTPLERILIERIAREGAITFRDFMHAALYDPEHGYYNTPPPKIGPQGDYYTSSNVHAAFGAILAKTFVELSDRLMQGDRAGADSTAKRAGLTLVEIGAGTGRLACDVITAIRDEHAAYFEELKYTIVETSPAMRTLQREKLAEFSNRVAWADLDEMESMVPPAIFFSNELVDAMSVHCSRLRGGEIEERWVGVEGNRLRMTWGEPSTPRLAEYVGRIGAPLLEDQVFEIGLDAIKWLERVARVIGRGCLVTIDYGDQAAHLWGSDRRGGTLRSFYKHRLMDSVLERPGHQDITASVNFTALIEFGRDFGWELESYERQAAFLIRMGLLDRIAMTESTDWESAVRVKERLAMKNLFAPGGVSDNFRVLIQRRSINY